MIERGIVREGWSQRDGSDCRYDRHLAVPLDSRNTVGGARGIRMGPTRSHIARAKPDMARLLPPPFQISEAGKVSPKQKYTRIRTRYLRDLRHEVVEQAPRGAVVQRAEQRPGHLRLGEIYRRPSFHVLLVGART